MLTYLLHVVSRIDYACGIVSMTITCPINFFVVVIILLVEIREAALVGIALLLFFMPVQTKLVQYLFLARKKSMVWTDARIQLLSEIFNGTKIVKLMGWELPFLERLGNIRVKEISLVQSILIIRAVNMAAASALPILGVFKEVVPLLLH